MNTLLLEPTEAHTTGIDSKIFIAVTLDRGIDVWDGVNAHSRTIGYYRDNNGNFIVTLIGTKQRICVLPGAFFRITGVSRGATAGRHEADESELEALGFIRRVTAV